MPLNNFEKPVVQLIETEDGSSSLYVPAINETYHSFHGALRESKHVFVNHGLAFLHENSAQPLITILEVGFGTGLNAILTLAYALENNIKIAYHTLEPFPLDESIVSQLNYPLLLKSEALNDLFMAMHSAEWDKGVQITDSFTLFKHHTRLEEFSMEDKGYNLVYFDAFAPNKQAELWEFEIFRRLYNGLATNGVLVTYCAKGQFKRDLKMIGFTVETLQGPPGKKEMVRGIKNLS